MLTLNNRVGKLQNTKLLLYQNCQTAAADNAPKIDCASAEIIAFKYRMFR